MKIIQDVYAAPINEEGGAATLQGLETLFGNVVGVVFSFAAIVLFVMLIVGGFKFLTSQGNPDALASARNTIALAIGGVILIALSVLIMQLIFDFTGADVINFLIYRNVP